MQDICRWISLSQLIGVRSKGLFYELNSAVDVIKTLETHLDETKSRLDDLTKESDQIYELEYNAECQNLRILARILFRKRESIILQAIKTCLKNLEKAKLNQNKYEAIINDVCLQIKLQLEIEAGSPKTKRGSAEFQKLSKLVNDILNVKS